MDAFVRRQVSCIIGFDELAERSAAVVRFRRSAAVLGSGAPISCRISLTGGALLFWTNEDAAQKRVSRALDKMRLLLERRGAALSATVLATALASEGLTAAPAALAAAAAPTAATALSVSTIVKMILMTPAKAWIITGSLVACISTASLVQLNLGNENQRLRQQLTHLAPLVIENERLSNQVSELLVANANAKEDENAMAKLRSEVGLLHKEKREMTDLRENLDRLSKELAQKGASNGPADDPQQRGVVLRTYNNASGFAHQLTQAMASVPEEQITQTFRRFLQENGISTSKPVVVVKDERNDQLLISASEADQDIIQSYRRSWQTSQKFLRLPRPNRVRSKMKAGFRACESARASFDMNQFRHSPNLESSGSPRLALVIWFRSLGLNV